METLFLIGRLMFGGYFIINGLNHFLSRTMLVEYAATKGVPLPELAVPISGLLILFGGISLLLGWKPETGIVAIVVFLLGVSFPIHDFWAETGAARAADFINFTKNMALIGATLMFVAVPRPWAYSVERPRLVGT